VGEFTLGGEGAAHCEQRCPDRAGMRDDQRRGGARRDFGERPAGPLHLIEQRLTPWEGKPRIAPFERGVKLRRGARELRD
jgi:hypothetical protein